jgi:hypothetical protein
MPRRRFEVIDIQEVLSHWYAGRSKSELARSLGIDRKTLRKYLAPAEAAGYRPGGPPVAEGEWARRVREWFPELVAPELRSPTFAEIARHHEAITEGLLTNTLATVHQRLRDERGLEASLASARRYVRAALPEQAARAALTVRKDDPPPGQEAQIDYGYLGPWRDPRRGTRRRVWAFCMCSRRAAEDPAEEGEGLGVPLQEGLLGHAREGRHPGGAGVAGAQVKQAHLNPPAAQADHRLAPVDLGLVSGVVDLGDEGLTGQPDLPAARAYVVAHGRLGHLSAVLLHQALPDPPRGMALLARRLAVGRKPPVDQAPVGAERGGRPSLGRFLAGVLADARAWRTARRWTPWRRASSRMDRCSAS